MVDFLGLPSECYPLYSPKFRRNAELLLGLILHEGNFGKKNWDAYTGTTRIQHKAYALRNWMSRSLTTCRIYPPLIGENIWRFRLCVEAKLKSTQRSQLVKPFLPSVIFLFAGFNVITLSTRTPIYPILSYEVV